MFPDHLSYPAVFTYGSGQAVHVYFPDLDLSTSGRNENDAVLSAMLLLSETVHRSLANGRPLPPPSRMEDIPVHLNEQVSLVGVML